VTRPEAATIALYSLGGVSDLIHTEDVAVRLETTAPGMFSWQRHRDRIDKELVRVALSDARLKAGYVIGSHAKGWMLTAAGVDFARQHESDVGERTPERRTVDDQQRERERKRLQSTDAYQKMVAGTTDSISADEADAFFRLNVYVRGASREKKIARTENQFGADPELGTLVSLLASRARERTS
jgi:hypothetical protein